MYFFNFFGDFRLRDVFLELNLKFVAFRHIWDHLRAMYYYHNKRLIYFFVFVFCCFFLGRLILFLILKAMMEYLEGHRVLL
jgi:hypothetical protein